MTRLERLRAAWGPQAQWDAWAVDRLLSHVGHLVPHTLLPVLRMVSGDPAGVDRAYETLLTVQREPAGRESPRARWRRRYGGFVREVEWASAQLVAHVSEAEVERLVVDEVSRGVEAWLGVIKPSFASLYAKEHGHRGDAHSFRARVGRVIEARLGQTVAERIFSPFNMVSFMVGALQVESFDAKGSLHMYIPECAFHTAAGTGLPQTRGCLWVCKAACERVFGPAAPLTLHFEPELPLLSCRLRMTWDPERLRTHGLQPPSAARTQLSVLP